MADARVRTVQLDEAWGTAETGAEWGAKLPPGFAEPPADVFARPRARRLATAGSTIADDLRRG
jgi:hypothetical protein